MQVSKETYLYFSFRIYIATSRNRLQPTSVHVRGVWWVSWSQSCSLKTVGTNRTLKPNNAALRVMPTVDINGGESNRQITGAPRQCETSEYLVNLDGRIGVRDDTERSHGVRFVFGLLIGGGTTVPVLWWFCVPICVCLPLQLPLLLLSRHCVLINLLQTTTTERIVCDVQKCLDGISRWQNTYTWSLLI